MQRSSKLLVGSIIITIFAVSSVTAGFLIQLSLPLAQFRGTFYFNDSGEHHGGFEMACLWNVTLTVQGSLGKLVVTPEPDYLANDALKKWEYLVSGFQISEETIVMVLDGHQVELYYTENDTIWNTYHNQYIGASPDLDPTIFSGFLSHFYVELRIAPLELSM